MGEALGLRVCFVHEVVPEVVSPGELGVTERTVVSLCTVRGELQVADSSELEPSPQTAEFWK